MQRLCPAQLLYLDHLGGCGSVTFDGGRALGNLRQMQNDMGCENGKGPWLMMGHNKKLVTLMFFSTPLESFDPGCELCCGRDFLEGESS